MLFVLLSKMYGGATFDLDRKVHMAHIAIILSENNLSDIIIEEIVCRNTCFVCNYNIWITFYIFLWNYESIKVGVQLVFNTIWEWHRFTAVIWENDTKSFIFPKLKMISAQNFEGNTSVVHVLLDARNGSHFVQNGHHFFIKFIKQGTCSKIIW